MKKLFALLMTLVMALSLGTVCAETKPQMPRTLADLGIALPENPEEPKVTWERDEATGIVTIQLHNYKDYWSAVYALYEGSGGWDNRDTVYDAARDVYTYDTSHDLPEGLPFTGVICMKWADEWADDDVWYWTVRADGCEGGLGFHDGGYTIVYERSSDREWHPERVHGYVQERDLVFYLDGSRITSYRYQYWLDFGSYLDLICDEYGILEVYYDQYYYSRSNGCWIYWDGETWTIEDPANIDLTSIDLLYAVRTDVETDTVEVGGKKISLTAVPVKASDLGTMPDFPNISHAFSYDETTGELTAALSGGGQSFPKGKYTAMLYSSDNVREIGMDYDILTDKFSVNLNVLGVAFESLEQLCFVGTEYRIGGASSGMLSSYTYDLKEDFAYFSMVYVPNESGDWFAQCYEGVRQFEYIACVSDGTQEVNGVFRYELNGDLDVYEFELAVDGADVMVQCDAEGITSVSCYQQDYYYWDRSMEQWVRYDISMGSEVPCDPPSGIDLTAIRPLFGKSPFEQAAAVKADLPADLTVIEAEAFAGTDITEVIIPEGVTSIGSRAFAGCADLVKMTIPASVTYIAEDAIVDTALDSIIAPAGSYAAAWAEEHGLIVK